MAISLLLFDVVLPLKTRDERRYQHVIARHVTLTLIPRDTCVTLISIQRVAGCSCSMIIALISSISQDE